MRVRGVNNGVAGPVSNEIGVPVTGGCQAPGAPTDFTGMMRGDTVYMGWNDGNGGGPATYMVLARYGSISTGAGVIASLGTAVVEPRDFSRSLKRGAKSGRGRLTTTVCGLP